MKFTNQMKIFKYSTILTCVSILIFLSITSDVEAKNTVVVEKKIVNTTETPSSYNFKNDLKIGSEGDDVFALQQILIKGGYLQITKPSQQYGYGPNGYYGEQTKEAVIRWQKARGITPASGMFGEISRTKANLGYIFIPSRGDESWIEMVAQNSSVSSSVSNSKIIAANTCTSWTYSDWSPCSAWGNQTRSIITSYPNGCAGGNFILVHSCNNPVEQTIAPVVTSTEASVGTFRPSSQVAGVKVYNARSVETTDDKLLGAAFADNGRYVGLQCKPWASKIASLVIDKDFILPLTNDNNYTWNLNCSGSSKIVAKNYTIDKVERGDIVQMKMNKGNWPHTAIVASATPTGMVWIHSNWQSKKTVSVDFITYEYFKSAFDQSYSIYHLAQ